MADENKVVQAIKDTLVEIGKQLKLHEGGLSLVDFKDGIVYIQLAGTCLDCSSLGCGFMANLEYQLRKVAPAIRNVTLV